MYAQVPSCINYVSMCVPSSRLHAIPSRHTGRHRLSQMAAMTMLNILPAFMVDQVKKQIKAKQKEIDAELEHAVDEMFAKLDTDHDGTINHDEVQSDYASESDTYLCACIDPSMPPSQNMRVHARFFVHNLRSSHRLTLLSVYRIYNSG